MKLWPLLLPAALILISSTGAFSQTLRVDAVTVGTRPLGVAMTSLGDTRINPRFAGVVANSGSNSVSVFDFGRLTTLGNPAAAPIRTFDNIPGPYAAVACGAKFLITSPSDNSIRLVDPLQGLVSAPITVGPEPRSAACYTRFPLRAVVSNQGDNTLAVVDVDRMTLTAIIPDVPASLGLHGVTVGEIVVGGVLVPFVWVAGTEANTVTLVDLNRGSVVTRLPIGRPTAVGLGIRFDEVFITSALDNRVTFLTASNLQVARTFTGISNPQDFTPINFVPSSYLAASGTSATIVTTDVNGQLQSLRGIPEISSAAAVAAFAVGPFAMVTSPDTNQVFFVREGVPVPSDFGAANAASLTAGRLAVGALASSFATTGVSQNFSATLLPLPKTLGGVSLRFGGTLTFDTTAAKWNYSPVGSLEAPLLFVGPKQINFQLPPGITPGDSVPAQLTKPDGSTLLTTVNITAASPGIFTVLQNGQGQAAVLNQDNSPNFGTNPAKRGSVIQIFATGAGDTDPPLLPGEPAPPSGNPLFLTRVQPTVTIGGVQARVLFSGMAPGYVGLWQINAEVPSSVTPGPAVALSISAGGVISNTVTIAVE